ncbi:hypothetical protein U9M48_023952 [Paspalum notatum var. saurae]|uniref:Uncharacterized protein n=1 Tax=Paspalum notatum var. saurae TaxID=547442 RepID=A0AAQ3TPS6_PASNO
MLLLEDENETQICAHLQSPLVFSSVMKPRTKAVGASSCSSSHGGMPGWRQGQLLCASHRLRAMARLAIHLYEDHTDKVGLCDVHHLGLLSDLYVCFAVCYTLFGPFAVQVIF